MRHGFFSAFLLLATVGVAAQFSESVPLRAQSGANTADGVLFEPALERAMEGRRNANRNADPAMLERFSTKDFIQIEPTGHVQTLAARVAALKAQGPNVGPRPSRSEQTAQRFGNTVIHTFKQEGVSASGQKFAQRWMGVWVKDGDNWKLAATQITNIAQ